MYVRRHLFRSLTAQQRDHESVGNNVHVSIVVRTTGNINGRNTIVQHVMLRYVKETVFPNTIAESKTFRLMPKITSTKIDWFFGLFTDLLVGVIFKVCASGIIYEPVCN